MGTSEWSRAALGAFQTPSALVAAAPPRMLAAVTEHRHLPHLRSFRPQPIIFLTAVTSDRRSLLANRPAFEVLTTIWQRSAEIDGWFLGDYLLMPDHVHIFAQAAPDAKPLATWVNT